MRIVTPRFVEIVALSIETAFRKIIIAGRNHHDCNDKGCNTDTIFCTTTFSAHMTAMMIAMSKKRGCIKLQEKTNHRQMQR
jgi:hypothetical protein